MIAQPTEPGADPQRLRHLIAGEWVDGGTAWAASTDPAAPARVVAEYPVGGGSEVDAAVGAAIAAAPGWAARSPLDRGQVLHRAADGVRRAADRLAALVVAEQGKPLAEARGEVARTAAVLAFHAAQVEQPLGEVFAAGPAEQEVRTVRVPVGVVGLITPWNFPLAIPAWKLAPALAHGNTVVWKPSSSTPALAVAMTRILIEAGIPDGALGLVLGPGRLGAALVDHDGLDAISFTGSEEVGQRIWARGGPAGPKVQLELGGNSPALVFADADLDHAVECVTYGALGSSGQKCTATRRVIVAEQVADRFRSALIDRLRSARVGPGAEPGVEVGPLISARARTEVLAAVEAAVRQGAELPLGDPAERSAGLGDGHFVRPTLLTDLPPDAPVLQDEVFGPVLSLHTAASEDEALALANHTRHGLSAAVFTRDPARARRCLRAVEAGMVHVNNPSTGAEAHVPFGGLKASSSPGPREQGGTARDFYTEIKTAYIQW